MCIHKYVYLYICVYINICVNIYIYVYINVYTNKSVYIYMCLQIYVYTYIIFYLKYIYIYVYMWTWQLIKADVFNVHIQMVGTKACALLLLLNRIGSYLLCCMPCLAQHSTNTTPPLSLSADIRKWRASFTHMIPTSLHSHTDSKTAKLTYSRKLLQQMVPKTGATVTAQLVLVSVHGLTHCLCLRQMMAS